MYAVDRYCFPLAIAVAVVAEFVAAVDVAAASVVAFADVTVVVVR